MGNQSSRSSPRNKGRFTVDKFIKEINIDVGRKNFRQIICEPFYNRQVIDKLLCFIDLIPICNQIKSFNSMKQKNSGIKLGIEISFYKLVLRYTSFRPINFPAKLESKLIQVSEYISDRDYDINKDNFVPNFESTVESLRKYLISETETVMKDYWEEIHKNSPIIKRLTKDNL